jgi:hypothetical protein
MAADGVTKIEFLPSDIKALATLLWAFGSSPNRFIGLRCTTVAPPLDSVGRPLDAECRDSNPATWHLAVVNQLGYSRRSLVMDADSAYEVWNHPILSYQYQYVNPKTGARAKSIADARVLVKDFAEDPYRAYRSTRATSIAGIEMDVTYLYENYASPLRTDDESKDVLKTKHFSYDLELDPKGLIIGGEWHSNDHPDFLWVPPAGSRSVSDGDKSLDNPKTWDAQQPFPVAWRTVARWTSHRSQPLAGIVEALIQAAAH